MLIILYLKKDYKYKQGMNFQETNKIYIIGIEGGGTSALARLLKSLGKEVVGVDEGDHFFSPLLKEKEITVYDHFDANHLSDDFDLIIHSSAFTSENNQEVKIALEKYPEKTITYTKAVALLFNDYENNVAICGTHGKTTVSAWLTWVLEQGGKKPSAIIGAKSKQLGGNSLVGLSDIFVLEADEYQNKLQNYNPKMIVLNNAEYDHPDFFKNETEYQQVFVDFVQRLPEDGKLIVNMDNPGAKQVSKQCQTKIVDYGKSDDSQFQIRDIKIKNGKQSFVLGNLGEFTISLAGEHNLYNASAVILTAKALGLETEEIRKHLQTFLGTERRLEKVGEYQGAIILDDFAHHPTEIRATLDGVKQLYPTERIVAVFHPHTFTRTEALFEEFAKSFELLGQNDELIILDIYGSAREKQGGVSSQELAARIKEVNNEIKAVKNISTIEECEEYLRQERKLSSNDLLLLIGAGDLWKIGKDLAE